MSVGILYNTFVCFISGLFSLVVFFRLREVRKKKQKEFSEGIDYFTLLLGLLWLSVGVRTFFVWLGRLEMDRFIFKWLTGPLTYLHLIPLISYFTWSFFPKKKIIRLSLVGFFIVLTLIASWALFEFGFTPGEVYYAGTDHTPNEFSNNLFTFGIFFPLAIAILIEFVRRFKNWRATDDPAQRQLFGFSAGFLVYALMGIFDALGVAQDWMIVLVRIGIMVAPLTFYLSATWEK